MKKIRIGTRNSPLALWQAMEVKKTIEQLGYPTEIIPSVSHGDKNLLQPLYQMNIVGVFTKDLDISLLNNEIDIAVHSLKDVPTCLPEGILVSAVLERDFEEDVLIRNPNKTYKNKNFQHLHIATGSLRRRAFWKATYPEVTFSDIRGNVQTRLKKLEEEDFDGTIFSLAGIKRLKMNLTYEVLDFIIPAPAQGVIGITSLQSSSEINLILQQINHRTTEICTSIERDFLQTLEGGCTAPIGALATLKGKKIFFKAGIISVDGKTSVYLNEEFPMHEYSTKGKELAENAKNLGADKIINEIKKG